METFDCLENPTRKMSTAVQEQNKSVCSIQLYRYFRFNETFANRFRIRSEELTRATFSDAEKIFRLVARSAGSFRRGSCYRDKNCSRRKQSFARKPSKRSFPEICVAKIIDSATMCEEKKIKKRKERRNCLVLNFLSLTETSKCSI